MVTGPIDCSGLVREEFTNSTFIYEAKTISLKCYNVKCDLKRQKN